LGCKDNIFPEEKISILKFLRGPVNMVTKKYKSFARRFLLNNWQTSFQYKFILIKLTIFAIKITPLKFIPGKIFCIS